MSEPMRYGGVKHVALVEAGGGRVPPACGPGA